MRLRDCPLGQLEIRVKIVQRFCPCLQIVWHLSGRRAAGGVLGYPERNIVADGQARDEKLSGSSKSGKAIDGEIIINVNCRL